MACPAPLLPGPRHSVNVLKTAENPGSLLLGQNTSSCSGPDSEKQERGVPQGPRLHSGNCTTPGVFSLPLRPSERAPSTRSTDEETEAGLPGGQSKDPWDLQNAPLCPAPHPHSQPHMYPRAPGAGQKSQHLSCHPGLESVSWAGAWAPVTGHGCLWAASTWKPSEPCPTECPGPGRAGMRVTSEVPCPPHRAHWARRPSRCSEIPILKLADQKHLPDGSF